MVKRLVSHTRPRTQKPSAAYLQVLRLFWRGENDSALATIADALTESTSQQSEALYRLWIEILAQDNDEASLRLLQDHINESIDFKHPSWVSRFALVGFIHYELGDVEAAHIVLRAMRKHSANAYYKELLAVLQVDADGPTLATLSRGLVRQTIDYLHYRRSCLLAHRCQKNRTMHKLFIEMEQIFGKNPLADEIGFHGAFGKKDYRSAWNFAGQLRDNFPVHAGYQFYYAYTSYLTQNNQLALEEFLQLNRRFNSEDPDVLCMIGVSLLTSTSQLNSTQKAQGRHYLKRAIQRLEGMGLSAAYPQQLLQKIDDGDAVSPGRLWMVKLSPRQCMELYERPLERIENLRRAMGEFVKKHDVCFFVSVDPDKDQSVDSSGRLVALYKASSHPEWHPTHRWVTHLKLQIRLEVSIPLEINVHQFNPNKSSREAQRYGLHELDESTLKYFEESIKNFTLEDQAYRQIFADLKTVGSL